MHFHSRNEYDSRNSSHADVIFGRDFQRLHSRVEFDYEWKRPSLKVCGLTALKVKPPPLFDNFALGWKPIAVKAVKSRCYSREDTKLIEEVARLLKNGIIELSWSTLRVQTLVAKV